jgi:hypothetical protein
MSTLDSRIVLHDIISLMRSTKKCAIIIPTLQVIIIACHAMDLYHNRSIRDFIRNKTHRNRAVTVEYNEVIVDPGIPVSSYD